MSARRSPQTLLWLAALTMGCFKLGGAAVAWSWPDRCTERVIARYSNVQGEGCGTPLAARTFPSEEFIASVSVTQCEGKPASRHTQVTISQTPHAAYGPPAPKQVVWRADAGDVPALLHAACGVEVLTVKPLWIGKQHLRLGYDRRARVTLEDTGVVPLGVTIAPYWLPSP